MDRLTLGDKLVGGGSLVLLILSILQPWAKFAGEGFAKGWDYGILMKVALILSIVLLGAVIAKVAGVDLPAMPPASWAGAGGVVAVCVLLQIVIGPPDIDAGIGLLGADLPEIERGIMLFLAIIPSAAIGYGGYLKMQEGGGTAPTLGGTGTGPAAPPPPPA